jgi:glycosyltransferase involved in cell wall biosynthesis
VAGKFLTINGRKFYVKGVTYGPFRPDESGCEYRDPEMVKNDFARIAENGFNVIRTYTVPPTWLLDEAAKNELRVIVGLAWEQHTTFLDSRSRRNAIVRSVREQVRSCAGHPAVLAFTVGNEIPPSIVRWYGRIRIERFIKRLYNVVKNADQGALVTYVNFPTTEYLQLPFLDIFCFNVFLESQEKLEGYLARLQNLAGEKPLLMTEIGLDSRGHGDLKQANMLDWLIRTAFAGGCAGACVFSWTDEWYRGGAEIEDWGFGLTDRHRNPKPALKTVRLAFSEVPFPRDREWPMISVVICTHNDSGTIREAIEGVLDQTYPNFELILVNDGSTDATAEIASEYELRLITVPQGGLSKARNIGMKAAKGEIIAYIDGDAFPDPNWLEYLAHAFMATDHVGVGGPNIAPHSDGWTAKCIDYSPGGPNHVLFSDQVAEHIPGCNMAFRKEALEAVHGFDEQFWIAGDDVDICWKLQESGGTLGYHPGAMVWHHSRNKVRDYLKQQFNYGKAEALLEMKWPEKYNTLGHLKWRGRMYSPGMTLPLYLGRWRIYHGIWGTNLFQSIYMSSPGLLRSLLLMPEWYLLIGALMAVSLSGLLWKPLFWAIPALVAAIGLSVVQALQSAAKTTIVNGSIRRSGRLRMRLMIAALHILQPLSRLSGRLRYGLTPWRRTGIRHYALPVSRTLTCWSEKWESQENRLLSLEEMLRRLGARTVRGSAYDRWDLEVRGGIFGGVRVMMGIEEHGQGRQLIKVRSQPRVTAVIGGLMVVFLVLTIIALLSQNWGATVAFWSMSILLGIRVVGDCSAATAAVLDAVRPMFD